MIQLIRSFKKILAAGIIGILFFQTASAQDGKALFQGNCAQCHGVNKAGTGPALEGLETRGPWGDKQQLYAWVHNPAAFMAKDPYTQGLKAKYNVVMQAFPNLATKEIDAIVDYVNNESARLSKSKGPIGDPITPVGEGGDSSLMFGIITMLLGIVALILLQVNSNLKKLTDEKEGIYSPEPVPFWKNKVYLLLGAIVFFVLGGFFLAQAAIGLGRHKDYQPEQPIYYSHKVHAGTNQINCLYCHGGAQVGKHANIPSVNVCMNCHMAINEYNGEKMYREDGTEVNGTAEIQKLYKYAGYDPNKNRNWDGLNAKKPIEWIRIHNLPDHVYFNHAQHVVAGKVACQTCHGPMQTYGEVKQYSDLSMGWCINCHRESKVQFNDEKGNGNKFYSIYEKFHQDIKDKKYDSVTVEMIGGTECQKCHY
jgi:cytochrome c551/c552